MLIFYNLGSLCISLQKNMDFQEIKERRGKKADSILWIDPTKQWYPGHLSEWPWKFYLTSLSFGFICFSEKQSQRFPWLFSHYNAMYSLRSCFSTLLLEPPSDWARMWQVWPPKSPTLAWFGKNSLVRILSVLAQKRMTGLNLYPFQCTISHYRIKFQDVHKHWGREGLRAL